MKTRKGTKKPISSTLLSAGMLVGTYICMLVMVFAVFAPKRYDLRAGQVAPMTITAPRDVVDSYSTQQLVDEAIAAVPVSYTLDETVQPAVYAELSVFFDEMSWLLTPAEGETSAAVPPEDEWQVDWTADDREVVAAQDMETVAAIRGETLAFVDEMLTSRITEDGLPEVLVKLQRELTESEQYDEALTELVVRHVSAYLRPNMLVDVETTEANRQKAEDSVEPIMYLKGRNIVRSGEIITQAQIVMLENLGMLADTTTVDVLIYLGVALLLLMVFVMLLAYMLVFEKNMWRNTRTVGLLCVILLVTVGACALLLNINQFLMPVTIGVMLTALLIRPRFAFVVNAALAVIVGMLNSGASGSFSTSLIVVMMTTLVSGTLCVILLNGKTQRLMVLLSGILVSGSNMLTTLAVGLITDANPPSLLSWAMWTAASGLLAAVLCIGLQPALEWVFNLITSAKLMELSNPNHPLIRRMILEASGTYHHSIIVANLAEAAADAIGANGLLARVGAYYHDIGKLKRPLYFKENQIGDNPHDRTDPLVSAAILTAHPTDGVELAMKYRMPKEILDIIQQHHGDTPVMYFYGQSVQREGAENVDINDFRYPGPRPQTKEAAVVMMADTVEAAARTATNRTSDGMEKLIRKLIRDKIDDGQLNQSPMTLEDIENVTRAFVTVLSGVFHQRIEYPDLKIPTRKDKKAKADSGAAGEKGEKTHA